MVDPLQPRLPLRDAAYDEHADASCRGDAGRRDSALLV